MTRLIRSARAIMSSRTEARDSRDLFCTPPWATRALMDCVVPKLGQTSWEQRRVWEPACGHGHIAEVLREYGAWVYATDIHDYGTPSQHRICDFLDPQDRAPCVAVGNWKFEWIITNPPFSGSIDRALAFTRLAIDTASVGVAMFVRSQWIVEGTKRYAGLLRPHPPTLIAFFSERVPLCKGRWDPKGSTATAYCWAIWIKGRDPLPPFWIPPGQRQKLSRPDDVRRFAAWSIKDEIQEAAE